MTGSPVSPFLTIMLIASLRLPGTSTTMGAEVMTSATVPLICSPTYQLAPSVDLTTRTGHCEALTTLSATLPIRSLDIPVLPRVPMTMMS